MAYVYKKFTAQDKALIPFNAHKQYNLSSASAALNSITYYTSSYTSESVSTYSSASSNAQGVFDSINNIKYNQIDHLFYRDYIKKLANKKDFIHPLKQRRDLYNKANIISIPSGLYGYEINKNSFYLSSSAFEITDDSFGNLIISGTNVNDYPNNVVENVFRLDPINGFKNYTLNTYQQGGYANVTIQGHHHLGHTNTYKQFYRRGLNNPDAPGMYTTLRNQYFIGSSSVFVPYPNNYEGTKDYEDSYFSTPLIYNNIIFKELADTGFPAIEFKAATGSYVNAPHQNKYNFKTLQDFSISFYIDPLIPNASTTEKRHIIAKSGTEINKDNIIPINPGQDLINVFEDSDTGINSNVTPGGKHFRESKAQYPFEIYMVSQSLNFSRSDGKTISTIKGEITASGGEIMTSHILCQVSSSVMQLYFNGNKIAETTTDFKNATSNNANLWIGSKGPKATYTDASSNINKHFNGSLSNINIWSKSFNSTQINNISESINASPYIGNLFYQSGLGVITHPKYMSTFSTNQSNSHDNGIHSLQFQGSHLIYEHEYQCTIQEHEFNNTYNTSTLDHKGNDPYKIEDFTTSSFFKPYVTTIGLYDENNQLLVVGKLGQPVRMSDETDTTFVLRWDT
tara:strand:- start:8 stop:1885 length:1878 start_codon:yes stop_codon:yes gene_type:complete